MVKHLAVNQNLQVRVLSEEPEVVGSSPTIPAKMKGENDLNENF